MLFLFSCTTDNEIITENESTSNLEVRTQEVQDSTSSNNRTLSASDELTLNMHWISFTASQVIMDNELAR
ncbi:MAG: hypothetical protein ACI9Y7_001555 [Dokdonia sp.]|jgi:hypothetical protein